MFAREGVRAIEEDLLKGMAVLEDEALAMEAVLATGGGGTTARCTSSGCAIVVVPMPMERERLTVLSGRWERLSALPMGGGGGIWIFP